MSLLFFNLAGHHIFSAKSFDRRTSSEYRLNSLDVLIALVHSSAKKEALKRIICP
jgi:hypothetical protein